MKNPARFGVDPKLASILGETYSSTERALRELVDNAWDADASTVSINIPNSLVETIANAEIVIIDDGTGMTEQEVRRIYLQIANDRFSRTKNARTAGKKRAVKGRKGIGKFAGLAAAHKMTVETTARGVTTRVIIEKSSILEAHAGRDLEAIDLPIESFPTKSNRNVSNGTIVTLADIDQSKSLPNPDILKRLLVREYARENGFVININGDPLQVGDLGGNTKSHSFSHPKVGPVKISWTVSEKPLHKGEPGFVYRVAGKVVGRPTFCGLEDVEDIPEKVRNRVWGEIESDGLDKHVTADWGEIIENSIPLSEIKKQVIEQVSTHLRDVCKNEINLARARLQKDVKARIEKLPEYRRQYAMESVERVIQKYFPEGDDKIRVLVTLVLDALERDEYYQVCERIANASGADVATIAECLAEFGLVDLAIMGRQARHRLSVLDEFERLANDKMTLEADIHKAIESNLWILGHQYTLFSSNQTLSTVITDYVRKGGDKRRARKRPDLFLGQNVEGRCLLIEFKRPSETVGRDAEAQVKKYRDELSPSYGLIDIMVLGGKVNKALRPDPHSDATFRSYMAIISNARTQLNWLLNELSG